MPCHMLKKKNGDCYHLLNAYYVAVPCLCPVTWSQWQGLWALRHGTSVWAGWGQHRNPSAVPEMLMGPSWLQMCPQISLLSVSMPFAMRLAVHPSRGGLYFLHREYWLALRLTLADIKWQCGTVPDPRHLCISSPSPCYSHALLDTCLLLCERAWAAPWITRDHMGQSRISQA